jgi:hypothetical protein
VRSLRKSFARYIPVGTSSADVGGADVSQEEMSEAMVRVLGGILVKEMESRRS